MTEHTTNPDGPVPGSVPVRPSAGELLRKLREEKGLTHAAVGNALHLTGHYIRALESDDYGKLPALTFVKGYLRSYARFIGADVETVVARFDERIAGLLDAGIQTERVQRTKRRQDQALRWAIGAGFVVVASLVAGWWFMSGEEASGATQTTAPAAQTATIARQDNPPAPAPATVTARKSTLLTGIYTPAPVATTNTAPEEPTTLPAVPGETLALPNVPAQDTAAIGAAVAVDIEGATVDSAVTITPEANGARQVSLLSLGEDELHVAFNGNSWIEVDDGRRVRLYNDMLRAGDTLTIRGAAPFHVLIGDATQVAVAVNTRPIDISGDIREDSTARLVLSANGGSESILEDSVSESAASEEAPL